MTFVLEAVYEDGVFKPLETIDLAENQRVQLSIQLLSDTEVDEILARWGAIYQDLTEAEIEDIEAIALNRQSFMEQS